MFVPARHCCGARPMNRLIANTVTCTLFGLLSMPTMAQNPAPKPAQAVLASRNDIGGKRIAMAEDFPDDQYAFKPVPAQRSFGLQLLHVAGSNGSIHPAIGLGADINRERGRHPHNRSCPGVFRASGTKP